MKSPHQARAKSTPKTITLEGGIKLSIPKSQGRASPSTKTAAKPTSTAHNFNAATG